jgi:hypothetical protein
MVLSMFSCSLDKFEKNSPDSDSISVQSDTDASENDNNTDELEKTDDFMPENEQNDEGADEKDRKDDIIVENDETPDLFKDDFEPDDTEETDDSNEPSTDIDTQTSDAEPDDKESVDTETDDDIAENPDEDLLEPYKNFTTILFGTDKNEYGLSLAMDNDGNLFLTGYTEGNLDGQTNSGESDIFLIKFDNYGNKLWTKLYGAEKNDIGRTVKTDSSGNIYITGYTEGDLDGNGNKGSYDAFLMKLDQAGEVLWVEQIGTEEADVSMSMFLMKLKTSIFPDTLTVHMMILHR